MLFVLFETRVWDAGLLCLAVLASGPYSDGECTPRPALRFMVDFYFGLWVFTQCSELMYLRGCPTPPPPRPCQTTCLVVGGMWVCGFRPPLFLGPWFFPSGETPGLSGCPCGTALRWAG